MALPFSPAPPRSLGLAVKDTSVLFQMHTFGVVLSSFQDHESKVVACVSRRCWAHGMATHPRLKPGPQPTCTPAWLCAHLPGATGLSCSQLPSCKVSTGCADPCPCLCFPPNTHWLSVHNPTTHNVGAGLQACNLTPVGVQVQQGGGVFTVSLSVSEECEHRQTHHAHGTDKK